ncbi:MAG: ADP-ribosylglycohydrolase family protein [Myxococcota bacterium]
MTREERICGALWGLAWGDALGAPIEGWSAEEIATTFGAYPDLPSSYAQVKMSRRARLRPPGLHTDDTQQALALLAVCLAPGGFSARAWGECLVSGRESASWRGTGKQFENAVTRLELGTSPETSGSPSAGIGAAMRTAPIGALFHDEPEELARVALESAAVTHGDVRALALSFAVAYVAGRFVAGVGPAAIRRELADAVVDAEDTWLSSRAAWSISREAGHQLSEALRPLLRALPEEPMALAARVLELGMTQLDPGAPPPHPNHAFALLGGHFALGMALRDDVEPTGALRDIVRLGEDTDTVAAIAGGLLGARFGPVWVPKTKLVDAEHLSAWADALVTRVAPEPLDALLAREAELTEREKTFQRRASPGAAAQ